MVFDFVYTHTKVLKKDFFEWFKTTMINAGWEYLSEGKSQDGYVFHSTGESGNENIGIHLRTYYGTSATRTFHESTYGYVSAKPFHTYTPSPNLTGLGTFEPNVSPPNIRLTGTVSIDTPMDIYYHVNKDRIVFVTKSNTGTACATFNLFGKPYTLAMTDEYNHCAIIGSHMSGVGIAGAYNNDTRHLTHTNSWKYSDLISGYVKSEDEQQIVSDLAVWNNIDGYKYILENVFITNFSISKVRYVTEQMEKDIYTDSNGYKYKLLVNQEASNLTDTKLSTFLIRVG